MKKIALCLVLCVTLMGTASAHEKTGQQVVQILGDVGAVAIPAWAYGTTLYYQDWTGTVQNTAALGSTLALTYLLKLTVHEERPNGIDDQSFPSGHTAAAFAGAGFLQMRYGWKVGIPAYLAAGLVGASRVYSDNHYWHDVLAGAAIGIGANLLFTTRYHGIQFTPMAGPGIEGVELSYNF